MIILLRLQEIAYLKLKQAYMSHKMVTKTRTNTTNDRIWWPTLC